MKNIVVVAGAGTGKTYRLVQEYLGTLATESPHRILAVTFTDKAATEMRQRVIAELDPTNRRLWRDMQTAPIQTFHSFAAQFLRRYALQLGIEPDFTLLSPAEEYELMQLYAEGTILEALAEGVFGVEQLVARFQLRRLGEANGLVDDLVGLYQSLMESGIAAKDLHFEAAGAPQNVGDAFDAFLGAKLSDSAKEKALLAKQAFRQLGDAIRDSERLEIRASAAFSEMREHLKGNFGPKESRQELMRRVNQLGAYLCDSETTPECATVKILLERFATKLQAYQHEQGVYGFGNLLMMTRDALRDRPDLRKAVKQRFARILVDEFQDTSPIQEDLVALLGEDLEAEAELAIGEPVLDQIRLGQGRLFVVGDPKQSIYGFRGADVSLFSRMQTAIVAQGGQRDDLTLCRRSQESVVQFVNLVAKMPENEQLSALRPANGPAGEIWQIEIGERDKDSVVPEALATQIQSILRDSEGEVKPSDIAVLLRRIRPATNLVRCLHQLGIPARVHGGEGFFSQLIITDMIAALQLVVDPSDELATITVLRSPFVGCTDTDIVALLDGIEGWKKGLSWQMLQNDFGLPISELREKREQMTIAQLIDRLAQNYPFAKNDPNIAKLKMLALGISGDIDAQIARLWAWLDDPPKESVAQPLHDEDAVLVMTIHQSKGLEFPIVILGDTQSNEPNSSENMLFDKAAGLAVSHKGRPISVCAPASPTDKEYAMAAIDRVRRQKRHASEAELSRLLYVALTRAREKIFVVDLHQDGKAIERGVSLRSLIFEGREKDASKFDELMPATKFVPGEFVPVGSEQNFVAQEDEIVARRGPVRLFASQLGGEEIPLSPPLLKGEFDSDFGSLAHRVIARVGMAMGQLPLQQLLNAAIRAEGHSPGDPGIARMLAACERTLAGPIARLIEQDLELSFEEPLLLSRPEFVIEGRADLIARGSKAVYVIDFKSTPSAASSQKTMLQLHAYAQALSESDSREIFVAPCLIGDPAPLSFHRFDDTWISLLPAKLDSVIRQFAST